MFVFVQYQLDRPADQRHRHRHRHRSRKAKGIMIEQTTQTRAPLNDSFKFFVANVDFHTTAAQVYEFFGCIGNVNQVKLLPPLGGGRGGGSA